MHNILDFLREGVSYICLFITYLRNTRGNAERKFILPVIGASKYGVKYFCVSVELGLFE